MAITEKNIVITSKSDLNDTVIYKPYTSVDLVEGAVSSINGITPDDNGNVNISSIANANNANKATTADKLANKRTITLDTAVSSLATYFDGSTNINIPVIGVKESYITWGGKNFTDGYGCIDAAMIPDLGANRLAFGHGKGITVEYSTDAGKTWLDYGYSDIQKTGIFATGQPTTIGKANKDTKTADCMLRITIDTDAFGVYTVLNKFAIYLTTNGCGGCYCTIDASLEDTPDTFVTFADKIHIAGWSGWNIINTDKITTYCNSPNWQYGLIRFTFGCTSVRAEYSGLSIYKIMGFGGVGWNTPSNMAQIGTIYKYNNYQDVFFPADITAKQFIGNLNGNANTANSAKIADSVIWDNVKNKPASFTPTAHNHNTSEITDLSKVAKTGSYDDLTNKPNFPNTSDFAKKDEIYLYVGEDTPTELRENMLIINPNEENNIIMPSITVGSVTTGDVAKVENVGTELNPVLNFVLPKGDKGLQGEKGDKGDKGDDAHIIIDTSMSDVSTNPVQNKVVKENMDALYANIMRKFGAYRDTISTQFSDMKNDFSQVVANLNQQITELKNELNNCDYVVETSSTADTWYRVYKSGWIEQGGFTSIDEISTKVITLPKKMANINYHASVVNASGKTTKDTEGVICVGARTTTTLTVSCGYINPNISDIMWEVKGKGA